MGSAHLRALAPLLKCSMTILLAGKGETLNIVNGQYEKHFVLLTLLQPSSK